jgi:hypothetical protein
MLQIDLQAVVCAAAAAGAAFRLLPLASARPPRARHAAWIYLDHARMNGAIWFLLGLGVGVMLTSALRWLDERLPR